MVARCVRDAEVPGSNPGSPTTQRKLCKQYRPPSSSGLGHHPFKVAARVRIPLGVRHYSWWKTISGGQELLVHVPIRREKSALSAQVTPASTPKRPTGSVWGLRPGCEKALGGRGDHSSYGLSSPPNRRVFDLGQNQDTTFLGWRSPVGESVGTGIPVMSTLVV